MTKKAIINNGIGSKVMCSVIDGTTLEALPILGTDNGDGTSTIEVTGNVAVTGSLTNTELRASDVKVTLDSEKVAISGIDAGTNLIGKVGIDQATANANEVVVKTSALPTGAATSALQTAGNASLAAIAAEKVQLHVNIDFSSASAQTIIAAPAAGNRIRICQLLLMSGATSPVNSEIAVKSGSTTIKTVKGATVVLDFPEHCNLGTAEALVLQATTADRVIGGVDYYIEAI